MPIYDPCPSGSYQDRPGNASCDPCPAGRFQNREGLATCEPCLAGTYYEGQGANSSILCRDCPKGKYGDKDGLAVCTDCPEGQYQPDEGKEQCMQCTDIDHFKTSNEQHTECVDNEALMSRPIMEIVFADGVGLAVSFAFAALFAILAAFINRLEGQYTDSADDDRGTTDTNATGDTRTSDVTGGAKTLARMEPYKVLLKAGQCGFSFSSEVILLTAMFVQLPRAAITMLIFRLLHPIAVLTMYVGWFSPHQSPEYLREMMQHASLHEKFILKHTPPMCVFLLASMCDVTMVQMMPWEESTFFTESQGYPSMDVMRVSLAVKSLQATVSVICQITFLVLTSDIDSPATSTDAKILFGLSIALSVITMGMGLMTFFVKSALLRQVEETGEIHTQDDASIELGDLYKDSDDGNLALASQSNPLHSAMAEVVNGLRRENMVKSDQLQAKEEEVRMKEEEVRMKDEQIRMREEQMRMREEEIRQFRQSPGDVKESSVAL